MNNFSKNSFVAPFTDSTIDSYSRQFKDRSRSWFKALYKNFFSNFLKVTFIWYFIFSINSLRIFRNFFQAFLRNSTKSYIRYFQQFSKKSPKVPMINLRTFFLEYLIIQGFLIKFFKGSFLQFSQEEFYIYHGFFHWFSGNSFIYSSGNYLKTKNSSSIPLENRPRTIL